jgi:1-acyl-sn-glycerol-3-phosphate acyltransferase
LARFTTKLFSLVYFRCRWHHGDRVPAAGPVIVAANHQSYFDAALIADGTRRSLHFLAVATAFRSRVRAWVMRGVQSVQVHPDQGMGGLKAILDRLRAGEAICVFPEGTRTFDGEFQPPRTGIGLLVVRSEAPVVPVLITGAYEAWPRHRRLPRPRRVRVTYGEPLDLTQLRAEARSGAREERRELYDRIAGELMAAIAALHPAHPGPGSQ